MTRFNVEMTIIVAKVMVGLQEVYLIVDGEVDYRLLLETNETMGKFGFNNY